MKVTTCFALAFFFLLAFPIGDKEGESYKRAKQGEIPVVQAGHEELCWGFHGNPLDTQERMKPVSLFNGSLIQLQTQGAVSPSNPAQAHPVEMWRGNSSRIPYHRKCFLLNHTRQDA